MVIKNLDSSRRFKFRLKEDNQKILKSILYNQKLNISIRWWAQIKRSKIERQSNLTRVRNRCVQTGRARSIVGFYKLSRLRMRKLASQRLLPGLRKASW